MHRERLVESPRRRTSFPPSAAVHTLSCRMVLLIFHSFRELAHRDSICTRRLTFYPPALHSITQKKFTSRKSFQSRVMRLPLRALCRVCISHFRRLHFCSRFCGTQCTELFSLLQVFLMLQPSDASGDFAFDNALNCFCFVANFSTFTQNNRERNDSRQFLPNEC